ncbi:MAG: N-formylglutamate amidohydrolase, partial [Hyphomicrobiaceae bacterium]
VARRDHYLITCEHGGNRIPARYRHLFAGLEDLLASHRGYDPGALVMAEALAGALEAPLFVSTTSRLLIELNRSLGHPRLYSVATRSAPPSVRQEILERHYLPYRSAAETHIREAIARGMRVVHLSSHSFTPELDGRIRDADVGLLYDPARAGEVELCRRWQLQLRSLMRGWKIRRNYPYTGKSDGFTAYLRRCFPADAYVGIELEINQKHVSNQPQQWRDFRCRVIEALRQAM